MVAGVTQQDIATRSQRLADAAGVVVQAASRLVDAEARDGAPRATITLARRALAQAVYAYREVR